MGPGCETSGTLHPHNSNGGADQRECPIGSRLRRRYERRASVCVWLARPSSRGDPGAPGWAFLAPQRGALADGDAECQRLTRVHFGQSGGEPTGNWGLLKKFLSATPGHMRSPSARLVTLSVVTKSPSDVCMAS